VEKIDIFVQSYKARARPFMWTATADSIFTKVQRLCECIFRDGTLVDFDTADQRVIRY